MKYWNPIKWAGILSGFFLVVLCVLCLHAAPKSHNVANAAATPGTIVILQADGVAPPPPPPMPNKPAAVGTFV